MRVRRLSVSVKNNSASFRSRDVIGQVSLWLNFPLTLDLVTYIIRLTVPTLASFSGLHSADAEILPVRNSMDYFCSLGADRLVSAGSDFWCHRMVRRKYFTSLLILYTGYFVSNRQIIVFSLIKDRGCSHLVMLTFSVKYLAYYPNICSYTLVGIHIEYTIH